MSTYCAIDCSGGTTPELLAEWITKASVIQDVVEYLLFDMRVFASTNDLGKIETLARRGGGGTDFRPVVAYVLSKTDAKKLVFFSDGFGPMSPVPAHLETVWAHGSPDNPRMDHFPWAR